MMTALLIAWTLLAASPEGSAPKTVEDPPLRQELLRRTEIDQRARFASIEWLKKYGTTGVIILEKMTGEQRAEYEKLEAAITDADKSNTGWLKEIVDQQGWPTISRVGDDGANAAWLLVQHADADPKFQRRCLDLMTQLPGDQVPKTKVAYLTDRVLLAEGKKQIYGTQFTQQDGKWAPRPLEDEENVEQRRAEAGLPPLDEYIRQLEKTYGPAAAK